MDIDWCIAEVTKGNCLPERIFKSLCDICMEILAEESNVQPVETPVNICGDIHGQFYDVLKLFTVGGSLPETSYIFIGDYVDRGYHSIETMQLLLCFKAKYPGRITLLRGNHESRAITQFYGFFEECQKKYGNNNAWKYCTDLFDYLPLGALVDGKVLCIHGGLSPDIKSIDQIRLIDRINEIPHEGPFSDLMWSDPEEIDTWAINSRGAGWLFGAKVTKEFVHLNGLELIARAHQLVMEGYKFWFPEKQLVTIWSAPNYCYRCGNVASILKLNENLNREFKIFESTPDPNQSQQAPKQTLLPYFL